jgi:hypothetical protein
LQTKIVELSNGFNWGKFLVARPDAREWSRRSLVETAPETPMLRRLGWDESHVWILDLATGEGACFRPGGFPKADLDKHRIWVCPMFEVFLGWFYKHPQYWVDIDALPELLSLSDEEALAASAFYGYRRSGGGEEA